MNERLRPNFVIFAGPNSSGKITLADILGQNGTIQHYLNADVIARGIAASGQPG